MNVSPPKVYWDDALYAWGKGSVLLSCHVRMERY